MPSSTLTVAQLSSWLGYPSGTSDSSSQVVIDAVNEILHRYDWLYNPDGTLTATATLGGLIQAGRWVKRKSSPLGIDQLADGSAVIQNRFDGDVEMLLNIGRWGIPVVA